MELRRECRNVFSPFLRSAFLYSCVISSFVYFWPLKLAYCQCRLHMRRRGERFERIVCRSTCLLRIYSCLGYLSSKLIKATVMFIVWMIQNLSQYIIWRVIIWGCPINTKMKRRQETIASEFDVKHWNIICFFVNVNVYINYDTTN